MPNINLSLDVANGWVKSIEEADIWLSNFKKSISEERFSELHGNIERIDRIQSRLSAIADWLKQFSQ